MENLTYLLILIIIVMAIISLILFYLALNSETFDCSLMGDPWYGEHMEAPGFNRWPGVPYGMRNEIRRGSEPFRYALKVARMRLTPEEERLLREESKAGGFEAFMRAFDKVTGKHASPEEYAEHHRRKESDMR